MNKILCSTILATSLMTGSAFAADAGVYAGVKFGNASVSAEESKDGSGNGFILGYNFSPVIAVELDIASYEAGIVNYDVDIDTTALYAAYRSEGSLFFKAKIGYINEEVKSVDFKVTDSGASYGIGAGIQNENLLAEVEYIIIEEDVTSLSVNLIYKF